MHIVFGFDYRLRTGRGNPVPPPGTEVDAFLDPLPESDRPGVGVRVGQPDVFSRNSRLIGDQLPYVLVLLRREDRNIDIDNCQLNVAVRYDQRGCQQGHVVAQ